MFDGLYKEIQKNKILFYVKSYFRQIIPLIIYQKSLKSKLSNLRNYDISHVRDRVSYYNKLNSIAPINDDAVLLNQMHKLKGAKAYYFDTFEITRFFSQDLKANLLFKDVIHIPDVPTLQKSRPIYGNNENAVILKLDKKRHFLFITDNKKFADKKNMLIGRGVIEQPHRIRFMELYFKDSMCDLGQINKVNGNAEWIKPKISLQTHLDFKFILSLEGNDVATNLKWVMSSNSIAVMPRPKYETWFMEGRLIGGYHFIELKDDYSDLHEKLNYYINHPDEAEKIIANAHQYIKQFSNSYQEELISLLVAQKYFYYTGQMDSVCSSMNNPVQE